MRNSECVCPSVDSNVCVCLFLQRSAGSPAMKDAEPRSRGENVSGKTNGLGLLSSCYLINVFNKERKTARCPNHRHISHVHLSLSLSLHLNSLSPSRPFHQTIFSRLICQLFLLRHGTPQLAFVYF